jgi:hypothetical protein
MIRLLACLMLLAPAGAQEQEKHAPKKEECRKGGICVCSWTWSDRPYTAARNYFITEKFWNRVKKVCWGELAQFECTEKPKGAREGKDIDSPALAKALEKAKTNGKLVLFIGMTGG